MANLDTAQIVNDLLGSSQVVYHQVLMTDPAEPHLKVDKLGVGDFNRVDSGYPGSNPAYSYEQKGLLMSVDRPANAPNAKTIAAWAAINVQNIKMPERFVLTATFIEPTITSPIQPPPQPTYAATILLAFGDTITGSTAQFNFFSNAGVRMNAPAILFRLNHADIAPNLYNQVIDTQNPMPLTLVLYVERLASDSAGFAMLFVGDKRADSAYFKFGNGLTLATVLGNILLGIATASLENYKASIYLTECQIWASTITYHRDFRPREITDLLGGGAWFTAKEKDSVIEKFYNLGKLDSDGIVLATFPRDPGVGNTILGNSAFLTNGGILFQPIALPEIFQLRATFCDLRVSRRIGDTTNPSTMGGEVGDAFEAAIVLVSAFVGSEGEGFEHVVFNMQTTDNDALGRGVRLFVTGPGSSQPEQGDFLDQAAFDDLYGVVTNQTVFSLNLIINKDPSVDSTAYLEVGGHRYNMKRPYRIPPRFFENGLFDIRALISTSNGEGLSASARLYDFEILELK